MSKVAIPEAGYRVATAASGLRDGIRLIMEVLAAGAASLTVARRRLDC
ncbi:MAG: hypothetical protein HIU88_12050 [Acidobacteria bacterium]|nr:hypothetical protein [Acidobacteriota bacterium]